MTKEQAKQHLAQNALLMFEHNGTSTLDGDATLELIDKIYDDFEATNSLLIQASKHNAEVCAYEIEKLKKQHEEELKKAYIEGGNDAWKALNCKELENENSNLHT